MTRAEKMRWLAAIVEDVSKTEELFWMIHDRATELEKEEEESI